MLTESPSTTRNLWPGCRQRSESQGCIAGFISGHRVCKPRFYTQRNREADLPVTIDGVATLNFYFTKPCSFICPADEHSAHPHTPDAVLSNARYFAPFVDWHHAFSGTTRALLAHDIPAFQVGRSCADSHRVSRGLWRFIIWRKCRDDPTATVANT